MVLVPLVTAAAHARAGATPAPVTSTGTAGPPGAGSRLPATPGHPAKTRLGLPFDGRREWPLVTLQARKIWHRALGAGVTVAVVDTGIGPQRDLAAAISGPVYNLTGVGPADDGTDTSSNSHGTAVAGIIAGRGLLADGSRMTGLAPDATLLDVRVAAQASKISAGLAAQGIMTAVRHGASVINISLTVAAGSRSLQAAVATAERSGAVVVTMAGTGSTLQALGALRGVIVVGATNRRSVPVPTGAAGVSLYAPGADLFSTGEAKTEADATASGYVSHIGGADYATAYTSAAIALLLSADHGLSAAKAGRLLVSTARHIPGQHGAGVMNPFRALLTALATAVPTPRPSKTKPEATGPGSGGVFSMRYLLLLPLLMVVVIGAGAFWQRRRRLSGPSDLPPTLWDQPW